MFGVAIVNVLRERIVDGADSPAPKAARRRWGDAMSSKSNNGLAGLDPFMDPLDAVLADVAVNLQLPPGLHEKATGRYEAVRTFAERPEGPLRDRILRFYPQGSMA